MINRRLCIAPMLDWTDRHFRYFARLISPNALLYTEMVSTGALLHGDVRRFLEFDPSEHPVALQLGGSDPAELALGSRLGEQWGYDEINLNVGCPSDRVQKGRFGACLMAEPRLVADCVHAMADAVSVPVSVKHRLGIDERDSYQELCDFVGTVSRAGCSVFIVHARKAWLDGLSPKENREIPPLDYDRVYRLKQDFPKLRIVINGGISTVQACREHLARVDGVMIGREAYQNPWVLAEMDRSLFGHPAAPETPKQVVERLLPFVEDQLARGVPLKRITRHILGLFRGLPGARAWRRHLSDHAGHPGAGASVIEKAASCVTSNPEPVGKVSFIETID